MSRAFLCCPSDVPSPPNRTQHGGARMKRLGCVGIRSPYRFECIHKYSGNDRKPSICRPLRRGEGASPPVPVTFQLAGSERNSESPNQKVRANLIRRTRPTYLIGVLPVQGNRHAPPLGLRKSLQSWLDLFLYRS